METDTLMLIKAGLIVAGVLGFGVWQIASLKRDKRRSRERDADPQRNRFRS